eukprot:jgi/Mesen1/9437/ME000618S08817
MPIRGPKFGEEGMPLPVSRQKKCLPALIPKWQQSGQRGAQGTIWSAGAALAVACLTATVAAAPAAAAEVVPSIAALSDFSEFQSGFASAFLLIVFSEIGDKTFFIAALLATRKSSVTVFGGTFSALAVMTVISVALGRIFHYADEAFPLSLGNTSLPLDDIAAAVLLVYFGVSTLADASAMVDNSKAEEEQQEAELAIASVGFNEATLATLAAVFSLVFLAEWGDKSFFATIALAASSSPLGVVTGAICGHGIATILAVAGGAFFGSYVSEKAVAYTGGTLFLVFAAYTLFEIANKL